jgi:hypothetical protein
MHNSGRKNRAKCFQTITFLTYILKVSGSNLGRNTTIMTEVSLGFPQSLHTNDGELKKGHEPFFPHSFKFFLH